MRRLFVIFVLSLSFMMGPTASHGNSVLSETNQVTQPIAPLSEAESKLGQIIANLASDKDLMQSLLMRRPMTKKMESIADQSFTKPLRQAWLQKEKQLMLENCGKNLHTGQLCGLEYDPFFCAQDIPVGPVFFKTLRNDKNVAVISVAWEENSGVVAVYELRQTENTWKVNGVSCTAGGAYNFQSRM